MLRQSFSIASIFFIYDRIIKTNYDSDTIKLQYKSIMKINKYNLSSVNKST